MALRSKIDWKKFKKRPFDCAQDEVKSQKYKVIYGLYLSISLFYTAILMGFTRLDKSDKPAIYLCRTNSEDIILISEGRKKLPSNKSTPYVAGVHL